MTGHCPPMGRSFAVVAGMGGAAALAAPYFTPLLSRSWHPQAGAPGSALCCVASQDYGGGVCTCGVLWTCCMPQPAVHCSSGAPWHRRLDGLAGTGRQQCGQRLPSRWLAAGEAEAVCAGDAAAGAKDGCEQLCGDACGGCDWGSIEAARKAFKSIAMVSAADAAACCRPQPHQPCPLPLFLCFWCRPVQPAAGAVHRGGDRGAGARSRAAATGVAAEQGAAGAAAGGALLPGLVPSVFHTVQHSVGASLCRAASLVFAKRMAWPCPHPLHRLPANMRRWC